MIFDDFSDFFMVLGVSGGAVGVMSVENNGRPPGPLRVLRVRLHVRLPVRLRTHLRKPRLLRLLRLRGGGLGRAVLLAAVSGPVLASSLAGRGVLLERQQLGLNLLNLGGDHEWWGALALLTKYVPSERVLGAPLLVGPL